MTALQLDTHAAIWWWTANSRLGDGARQAIAAGERPVYLSAASVWELAIKIQSEKLDAIEDFPGQYPLLMADADFLRLDVTDEHALKAGFLSGHHRDPFDRLIAAQALIEEMTVVTRDPQIAAFGCRVLW